MTLHLPKEVEQVPPGVLVNLMRTTSLRNRSKSECSPCFMDRTLNPARTESEACSPRAS